MEYRVLPHGGEQVSVIGMGSSVIGAQPEKEIIATVRAAVDSGVNYFDMAGGHAAIFAAYGKALEGIRDKVYLQIHFGADYTSGEYGWTTELAEVKRSVAWRWSSCGRLYRRGLHPLSGRGERPCRLSGGRRAGLCAGAEKAGRDPSHRPVLPHPGAGEQGAG